MAFADSENAIRSAPFDYLPRLDSHKSFGTTDQALVTISSLLVFVMQAVIRNGNASTRIVQRTDYHSAARPRLCAATNRPPSVLEASQVTASSMAVKLTSTAILREALALVMCACNVPWRQSCNNAFNCQLRMLAEWDRITATGTKTLKFLQDCCSSLC